MTKKIYHTLIAVLIFNFSIMAQKGFNLEKEQVINVPASELWQMVGPGFIDVYKWSSNVDHAEGSGSPEFEGASCSERSCDLNVKGFNKISEKLTIYNEKSMKLAYEVLEGMPGFVEKASNEWTVVSINEKQSKLVMKAEFRSKGLMGTLMNGMMEKKMNKLLEVVLNDAKVYAETGKVSEVKEKRMAKVEKQMKQAA